jgi:hypothetical protein
MDHAVNNTFGSFGAFLASFLPGRISVASDGMFAGLRAYHIYNALNARSDISLSQMGLKRSDLPQTAFERAFGA